MRFVPTRVTQEELNSKKVQSETRGTSKEAFIEGDPKRTNIIEANMYDTIPIH